MLSWFRATPLRQALWSMLGVGAFAVILHFTWGAVDPEMDGWSVLGAAPPLGVLTYLHASGRESAVATLFIVLGVAGLLFWIGVISAGVMPVARADLPWVVLIFSFPLVALGIGLHKRRQLRRGTGAPTA